MREATARRPIWRKLPVPAQQRRWVFWIRPAIQLCALFCACVIVWKLPSRYPQADICLGVDLVAMAMLGGIVSAHAPAKLLAKILYIIAFIVLAIIGFRLVNQQSSDTARASKEFQSTLSSIAASSSETVRVQALNTQLQRRLLAQSSTIADLGTQGIRTATGGDSFCSLLSG